MRPWPPPTKTRKPVAPLRALHDPEADVVEQDRGAILGGAGDGDLELARQEGELGMDRRPLPQHLGPHARVLDLVGGDAGVGIGGDIADAVAAGLDGVHLDLGQRVEDVGRVLQPGPVELDVLARREVAEAAVPLAGDVGQLAHLPRRQHAVGNGDAQHVGMQLQVEAVLQPQRLELLLGQLAGEPPRDLAAELRGALGDEGVIEIVVAVHRLWPQTVGRGRRGCARGRRWGEVCRRSARRAWHRRR